MALDGGKTGWPPGLLQDDCRPLHKWFANKPDARRRVREVAAEIRDERCRVNRCNEGRACPTRQACELPDDDSPAGRAVLGWIVLIFLAVIAAAVIARIWS